MIIVLTGFMGCGKSSIGKELASLLRCPFIDLDEHIVELAGVSIPDIFASEGEEGFRERELEALRDCLYGSSTSDVGFLTSGHSVAACHSSDRYSCHSERSEESVAPGASMVLSLGGGTPMRQEAARLIKESGTLCVYLRATEETLRRNLGPAAFHKRPMLRSHSLTELLAARTPTYESLADITLDIDGLSVPQLAQLLAAELRSRQ